MTIPIPKIWRNTKKKTLQEIREDGMIIGFSFIHQSYEQHKKQTPYCIGRIKLSNGEIVTGRIVDWQSKEEVSFQKKVVSVKRKHFIDGNEGLVIYGMSYSLV